MDARFTKAEGSCLPPRPRHPDAERIFETRAAAHAAHEAAIVAGFRRFAGHAVDLVLAWPRRQRLLAELGAMSDRDLADIGLARGDFVRVLAAPLLPARRASVVSHDTSGALPA